MNSKLKQRKSNEVFVLPKLHSPVSSKRHRTPAQERRKNKLSYSSQLTQARKVYESSVMPRVPLRASRSAFECWKQTRHIPKRTRVFIIEGSYPAVRAALQQRGWVENADSDSLFFDLKWACSSRVPAVLGTWQVLNHFQNNTELTTKSRLTENLAETSSSFYPRSCIVQSTISTQFKEMFKTDKAFSCLRRFLEDYQESEHADLAKIRRSLATAQKAVTHNLSPKQKKSSTEVVSSVHSLRAAATTVIEEYARWNPQHSIDGKTNLWIVKPARKSRGRDILVTSSLKEARRHIQQGDCWVFQKYIERPLLINNRKFDIRQWVLVTGQHSIKVYIYEDSYLRFAPEDFNLQSTHQFVHLTNNAIAKQHPSTTVQEMWHIHQFREYLKQVYGSDVWSERLFAQIQDIVAATVKSAGDLNPRKWKAFELLGFDFLIDETLNPWLLEVNSSPSMEYSTPVTTELVQQVSDAIIKVVIDKSIPAKFIQC